VNPHQENPPLVSRRVEFSRFRVLILLAALGLAGCSSGPRPRDEGPGEAQALPIQSFQQQWSTTIGKEHGRLTQVYAMENMVFAYTEDGTSYVLDRTGGRILYANTIRHGAQRLHPPVVLKNYVVYPTTTSLEIYDKSGALLMSKDLKYSIRSDAVGTRNYVYMGADFSTGGRIVCVDVTDRYLDHRWYLMFPGVSISAAPVLVGDVLYVAGENSQVAAVTYDTRDAIWPFPGGAFKTYGSNYANLAGDESGIYVASSDTTLYALDRARGHVKWQYLAQAELREAPVVTKTTVYEFVPGTGLLAIDKIQLPGKGQGSQYNRTPSWIAADADRFLAEDDKYTYVRRTDNAIVALDRATGKAAFASRRHDFSAFFPNTHNGTIYIGTVGNRVLSITPVLKPGVVGEIAFEPVNDQPETLAAR